MDKTIKTWMNILLFTFLMLVLSFIIYLNIDHNKDLLLLLSSFLIVSVSIRYLFIYESPRLFYWGLVSILIDAVIIFLMNNLDMYKTAKIFYLVLAGESILFYPVVYGLVLTVLSYFVYIFSAYAANRFQSFHEFLPEILSSLAALIFIIVVMAIVKYVVNQHAIINSTMEELSKVNKKLEENSNLLQKMAVVKERNRIAGEVHDTVGHTLTTVLIEIQAGKSILKKDINKAIEKFDLAEEQVRCGLNDIMKTVKLINDENNQQDILTSINKLIDETQKHAGVKINCDLTEIPEASLEIQNIVCKSLKEGLTNGIRHGKSTQFDLLLKNEKNCLIFTLTDNGSGCDEFKPGYGISTMTKRIEEAGGSIEVKTKANSGFKLLIKIPLVSKEN